KQQRVPKARTWTKARIEWRQCRPRNAAYRLISYRNRIAQKRPGCGALRPIRCTRELETVRIRRHKVEADTANACGVRRTEKIQRACRACRAVKLQRSGRCRCIGGLKPKNRAALRRPRAKNNCEN